MPRHLRGAYAATHGITSGNDTSTNGSNGASQQDPASRPGVESWRYRMAEEKEYPNNTVIRQARSQTDRTVHHSGASRLESL
jgi:hypothetical protein